MESLEMTDIDQVRRLLEKAGEQIDHAPTDIKGDLAVRVAGLRLEVAKFAHQREIDLLDRGHHAN